MLLWLRLRSLMITVMILCYDMILTFKLRRAVTKNQELQPIDRGKKIKSKVREFVVVIFFPIL